MAFQVGDIVCVKLTGELVTVLDIFNGGDGPIKVRRPVVSHEDGITHFTDTFQYFELETEESHLRREANSMILKIKVQKEMQKELEAIEEAEKEDAKPEGFDPSLLVN